MNDNLAMRLQHILGTIVNKGNLSASDLHWLAYVAGRGIEPDLPLEREEFGVRFAPDAYVHGHLPDEKKAQILGDSFHDGEFEIVKRQITKWQKVSS